MKGQKNIRIITGMKPEPFRFVLLLMSVAVFGCSTTGKNDPVVSKIFKGNRLVPEAVNRVYIDSITGGHINSAVRDNLLLSLERKLNGEKKLALVHSPEKSDLKLRVHLERFSSEAVKHNVSGDVDESKLRIECLVWIISSQNGDEIIKEKKVDAEQMYSEINPPVITEFRAITLLTDKLAGRIISVILTGWYLEK